MNSINSKFISRLGHGLGFLWGQRTARRGWGDGCLRHLIVPPLCPSLQSGGPTAALPPGPSPLPQPLAPGPCLRLARHAHRRAGARAGLRAGPRRLCCAARAGGPWRCRAAGRPAGGRQAAGGGGRRAQRPGGRRAGGGQRGRGGRGAGDPAGHGAAVVQACATHVLAHYSPQSCLWEPHWRCCWAALLGTWELLWRTPSQSWWVQTEGCSN